MMKKTTSAVVCLVFVALAASFAHAESLYFLNTDGGAGFIGHVDRVNVDGQGRQQVASVQPAPFGNIGDWKGFATDGRYFYYANTEGAANWEGQIERTNLDGTNRTVVVPAAASPFTNLSDWKGLATDGRHFYFLNTENGGTGGGKIDRINMDGSGRVTVADVAPSQFNSISAWKGFATDGRKFYYLNTEGGTSFIGQIDTTTAIGTARTNAVLDVQPTPFNSITSWKAFAISPSYKPAALYRMDEPPAVAPVLDTAGGNDGTLINPARVTKGVAGPTPVGAVYDFQPGGGQGGGVNLGGSHTVQPTDDFTISFRFQADVLDPFDRFVESMNGTAGTSRGLRLDMGGSGNKVRALLRDGSGTSDILEYGGTVLQAGEWYFASVRYDKDANLQVTVIPDSAPPGGTVVGDNTGSQAATLSAGVTYAGTQQTLLGVQASNGPTANAFDGRMDDVAFYSSVLSNDQVKFVRRFGARNSLPDEAWDAADPGANPDGAWQSNLGGGVAWNLTGTGAPTHATNVPTTTNLTEAYRFAGTGRAGASAALPGRDLNLTAELWVKPTDFVGQEILLEAGGDGNGFSLLLDGNQLRFRMDQDSALPGMEHLEASTMLPDYLLSDFFQVAGVIDLAGNAIELYLNGELVGTDSTTGDITAWAGGNADSLGSTNGQGTNIGGTDSNDLDGFGTFEGLLGAVRMHHRMLSGEEIRASFEANAPVPEPLTLATLALAGAGLGTYVRRRRRRA